jgi:hypothetical protein
MKYCHSLYVLIFLLIFSTSSSSQDFVNKVWQIEKGVMIYQDEELILFHKDSVNNFNDLSQISYEFKSDQTYTATSVNGSLIGGTWDNSESTFTVDSITGILESFDNSSFVVSTMFNIIDTSGTNNPAISKLYFFDSTVPLGPQLISPFNNSTSINFSVLFNWSPVFFAATYNLQVSIDPSFISVNLDQKNIVADEYMAELELANQKYYWRVAATNSNGIAGEWSETWSFTTQGEAPGKIQLVAPDNNSTSQSLSQIFEWMEDEESSSYQIHISDDSNFLLVLFDIQDLEDVVLNNDLPDYDKSYFWRVRGINVNGEGPWSDIWKFTTMVEPALVVPKLLAPSNGQLDLELVSFLNWEIVEDAVSYEVQVAKNDQFNDILLYQTNIMSGELEVTLPDYLSSYYWKVRARYVEGLSSWSEVWTFRTKEKASSASTANLAHQFTVFPNPSDGNFVIDLAPGFLQELEIFINNSEGKSVFYKNFEANALESRVAVKMETFPFGIYTVILKSGDQTTSKAIVIQGK